MKLVSDATGRWFFPATSVSFTNKSDRPDITEMLLKVALSTLTLILFNHQYSVFVMFYEFLFIINQMILIMECGRMT